MRFTRWALTLLVVFALGAIPAAADTIIDIDTENTLHLACTGCVSVSFSGGDLLVTGSAMPTFEIFRSPHDNSGLTDPQLVLAAFVNGNSSLSFGFTNNGLPIGGVSAGLVKPTAWTSGDLVTYLGLSKSGGPASPISAFTPPSGGFFVYTANMGSFDFTGCQASSLCGLFSPTISLPAGTILYAYEVNGSSVQVDTGTPKHPNFVTFGAGTLIQDDTAPSSSIKVVPEPTSLVLFGSGLIGAGTLVRRRNFGGRS